MKRHAILSLLGLLFIMASVIHWSRGQTIHSLYPEWTVNLICLVFFFIGSLSIVSMFLFLLKLSKFARLMALLCLGVYIFYIAFSIILTIVMRMSVLYCVLELFILSAVGLLFIKFYTEKR